MNPLIRAVIHSFSSSCRWFPLLFDYLHLTPMRPGRSHYQRRWSRRVVLRISTVSEKTIAVDHTIFKTGTRAMEPPTMVYLTDTNTRTLAEREDDWNRVRTLFFRLNEWLMALLFFGVQGKSLNNLNPISLAPLEHKRASDSYWLKTLPVSSVAPCLGRGISFERFPWPWQSVGLIGPINS